MLRKLITTGAAAGSYLLAASASAALFEPKQSLVDSIGVVEDRFGISVAVDGNIAVVGADSVDVLGQGKSDGIAVVYEKQGGSWVEVAHLNSKLVGSDRFGYSVAISGDTIVVGAWEYPTSAQVVALTIPSVYVFVKPATGWADMSQTAILQPSVNQLSVVSGNGLPQFGFSVDISNDVVVVGAPGYDVAPSGADCPVGITTDNTVTPPVTSTVTEPSTGIDAGAAFVFARPAAGWSGTLAENAVLVASDACHSDGAGISVAIDADTVLVGASARNGGSSAYVDRSGAAYLFEKPIAGWGSSLATPQHETSILTSKIVMGTAHFGYSVDLSADVAVVGAFGDSNALGGDTNSKSGAAFVFEKPVTGWAAKTTAENAHLLVDRSIDNKDIFGHSVAISGDYVVTGAPLDDDGGEDSGSIYLFKKPDTGWGQGAEIAALLPHASGSTIGDLFGYSVAISGSVILAGAPVCSGIEMEGVMGSPVSTCKLQTSNVAVTNPGPGSAQLFSSVAQLAVAKTDSATGIVSNASGNELARPNGDISYTISVTNNDTDVDATQVVISDPLPAGMSYQSAQVTLGNGSCVESGGQVDCSLSDPLLKNGGVARVEIVASAPLTAEMLVNTASVSYAEDDMNSGNNASSVTTQVNNQSMALESSFSLDINKVTSYSGALTGIDADGDNLSVALVQQALNGTVSVTNPATGAFSYQPNQGFSGTDTFSFQVSDLHEASAAAMVTAFVANLDLISKTIDEGGSVDVSPPSITAVISPSAAGSRLTLVNGTVTYTPPYENYFGVDHFAYETLGGGFGSVEITINPVNDAPVAKADTISSLYQNLTAMLKDELLINDSDVDNDPLVIDSATALTKCTVEVVNGAVVVTPFADATSASFEYTVSDGTVSSEPAVVTLTFKANAIPEVPTVTPPTLSSGDSYSFSEAQLIGSATDSDGDTVSILGMPTAQHGTISVDAATGEYLYTPDAGFSGYDTIGYTLVDSKGTEVAAAISVEIAAPPASSSGGGGGGGAMTLPLLLGIWLMGLFRRRYHA